MNIVEIKYFGEIIFYRKDATIPEKMVTHKYQEKHEVINVMREQLRRYREKGWTITSIKIKCEQILEEDVVTIA